MKNQSSPNQRGLRLEGHRRWLWIALLIGVASAAGAACSLIGPGNTPGIRVAFLLGVWVFAGWQPLAYLLSAVGWGVATRRWIIPAKSAPDIDAFVISGCIGLAVTLSLTHAFGVLGLLNPVSAWVWTGLGLVLFVGSIRRLDIATEVTNVLHDRWSLGWLCLGMCGVGVMLAASAMPPQAQWDSEFGGYDSLSYHLQLPAEWMEAGRIAPSEHNVYSYLPGYVEAAYMHMAQLAATEPIDTDGIAGLASGHANGVMSANLLAVFLAIFGACTAGRLTYNLLGRSGVSGIQAARGACAAGSFLLLTPWIQVVGSMAYNETGVVALGGAALLVSCMTGITPIRRGTLVAVLMGAAAGCKPTAVLFLAPACVVLMSITSPTRTILPMLIATTFIGTLMLAPWLARNTLHGGNPVFPQAIGLFGSAHWNDDQAGAYSLGHSFNGSIGDRFLMLARPDPSADPNGPAVARWRGLTNPQWALTPWIGLAGCIVLILGKGTRRIGFALMSAITLGLVAWISATHLQSRFLVPLTPLFVGAMGAGIGSMGPAASLLERLIVRLTSLLLGVALIWSVTNFAQQRQGRPNELLGLGAGIYTGAIRVDGLSDAISSAWISESIPSGKLLLVGDAAPLYYRRPIGYATVWDRNPLSKAIRESPNNTNEWSRALRSAGYEWVYISFAELSRLAQSGWNDPILSLERVQAWTIQLGEPIRVWPESGSILFRLPADD